MNWQALLPQNLSQPYAGHLWAAHVVSLLGVVMIVSGLLHILLPDSGAGVIAGIPLDHAHGSTLVAMLAYAGISQVPLGVVQLLAGLRYRALVPLMLLLSLLARIAMTLNATLYKPMTAATPPETYITFALVPVLAVALWGSLRKVG